MLKELVEGVAVQAQPVVLILAMQFLAVALNRMTKAIAGWDYGLRLARLRPGLLDGECSFVDNGQLAAVRQRPERCLALYGAPFLTNFGLLATMTAVMALRGIDAADYFCLVFACANLLVLLLAFKPGSRLNEDLHQLQAAWRTAQAQ